MIIVENNIDERNTAFHGWGGLQEQEVYQAWGTDVKNREQCEKRVLNCLNFVSGQRFNSLADGSIFSKLHSKAVAILKAQQ